MRSHRQPGGTFPCSDRPWFGEPGPLHRQRSGVGGRSSLAYVSEER